MNFSTGVFFRNFSASSAVKPGIIPTGSTVARMSRSERMPTILPSPSTTGIWCMARIRIFSCASYSDVDGDIVTGFFCILRATNMSCPP
jgi:hypothetical protein